MTRISLEVRLFRHKHQICRLNLLFQGIIAEKRLITHVIKSIAMNNKE